MLEAGGAVHQGSEFPAGAAGRILDDLEALLPTGLDDPLDLIAAGHRVFLDRRGAEGLLIPDHPTGLVEILGDPATEGAEGDEDVAGAVEPRTHRRARLDHLGQPEQSLAPDRRIPPCRDPVRQVGQQVRVLFLMEVALPLRSGEDIVGMEIDEAGNDRLAGEIDGRCPGRPPDLSRPAHAGDPAVRNQDVASFDDLVASHRDEPRVLEEHGAGGLGSGHLERHRGGARGELPRGDRGEIGLVDHRSPGPQQPAASVPPIEEAPLRTQQIDGKRPATGEHVDGFGARRRQRRQVDVLHFGERDPAPIRRRDDLVGRLEPGDATAIAAGQINRAEGDTGSRRFEVVDPPARGVERRAWGRLPPIA